MNKLTTIAPDKIEFTYDVSSLPVLDVRGDDFDGFRVPNEGHRAQPMRATVSVTGGVFTVHIEGYVVKNDGSRNNVFTTYVTLWGHKEIKQTLAEMVADKLRMTMIGRFS